jgi:hypothetical protein
MRNRRIEMAIELARDERTAGTPFRFFLFHASVICIHAQDKFEFANATAFPGPFCCVSASGECAVPYRPSRFTNRFHKTLFALTWHCPPAPLPLGAPALFQPPAFVDPTDSLDLDPSKV